jgi:predicted transcriptional regulator
MAPSRNGRVPRYPKPDAQGNYPAFEVLAVSIAREILRRRRAAGLSQERLAHLAGVRPETIHRIETAKHSPSVRTIDKIDRALAKAEKKRAR